MCAPLCWGLFGVTKIGAKGSIVWEGYILVTSKQTNKHLSWYTNSQIVPKGTTFYPMSFVQRTLVTFISRSNYIIFISGIYPMLGQILCDGPTKEAHHKKKKNWAFHAPTTHYTNHTIGVPMFDVLIWVYLYFML